MKLHKNLPLAELLRRPADCQLRTYTNLPIWGTFVSMPEKFRRHNREAIEDEENATQSGLPDMLT